MNSAPATLPFIFWQGRQQFFPKLIHCLPHVSAVFSLVPQVTLCRPCYSLSSCLPSNLQLPWLWALPARMVHGIAAGQNHALCNFVTTSREGCRTALKSLLGSPRTPSTYSGSLQSRAPCDNKESLYPRVLLPYCCCRVETHQPGQKWRVNEAGLHAKGCH